jgi:uncharacterized membrane protein (UPF0136 family)
MMSLIAGGGSGALILALEYMGSSSPASQALFSKTQAGLSAFLMVSMWFRYHSSGKFMPAGVVSMLSALITVLYIGRGFSWAHTPLTKRP